MGVMSPGTCTDPEVINQLTAIGDPDYGEPTNELLCHISVSFINLVFAQLTEPERYQFT